MVFFGTFFSIVFFAFACVRAHTSAHAVSVSVAFSISLPAFSLSRSFVDSQRTTHINILDVGKEKWQHSFPSYVFLRSFLFCNACVFVSLYRFLLFVRIISNIANKTIIVTTTTTTNTPSIVAVTLLLPLPHCSGCQHHRQIKKNEIIRTQSLTLSKAEKKLKLFGCELKENCHS